MILNQKYQIYLLISAYCLINGCNAGKKFTDSSGRKEDLNVSQRIDYEYILTEATKQKLFGNFKQAITLYQKCIQVNRNSDIAYYELGNIFLVTGNYENALTYARKAVELNSGNYWYEIQLAQLYLAKNYKDSAKIVYEQILEKWPEKVEINFELARIYAEEKEYDKSLKILNKIEKENGISEPVSMLREQIYVQTGKTDMAVNELLKLIELMPDEIRYLGLLAELYNSAGRNKEAQETYERIFRIEPDNVMAMLSYAEFMRDIGKTDEQYKILEKIFRDENILIDQKLQVLISYLTDEKEFINESNKIGELINILMELYPENYKVKTAHADYLVKNNKYAEALEEYNQVLSVEKNNYFIWEQVLFIENMLGNNESVYERSDEAMKIFKDKPVLYLFKGNAAMRMGNNEEAISVLEEGMGKVNDNQPLEIQFYSLVAEAYRGVGNHEKSDDYYEKAIKLDPENLVLLNNYSYFLSLRQKKLDIAEKMSKKTILAEPENYTYLDTYAWILFNSGNFKKALEYIEKAFQFNGSDDPDILEHYGDILDKLGKTREAVKYWKLSIENGNDKERITIKIKAAEGNE
jgi:tetratricopeptide (TPR) repeat protein